MIFKKYFSGIFLLIILNSLQAQVVDLTGAIMIGKTEALSYSVFYTLDKTNHISGYSISDLYGFNETKSSIIGTYDPAKKILRFEETAILYTKSTIPKSDFCLMQVEGKFTKKAGKNFFEGSFVSHSPNNKIICDPGTIALFTTDEIYRIAAKAGRTIQKVGLPDSVNTFIAKKIGPIAGIEKVRNLVPGSQSVFNLLTDTITLEVFDNYLEDGDKISILKNNTILIKDLEIKNQVKTFKINIKPTEKMVVFSVIACNEGSSPPNTVKIVLTNGPQKELLICSMNKNQMIRLMLKRD